MQFLAFPDAVRCPLCDTPLTVVREWDQRVALMRHEGRTDCTLYWKHYRVDRMTGYAEGHEYAQSQKPAEVPVPQAGSPSEGTLG